MKATIEFNIPEEQNEFDITVKAHNLLNTLHEMSEWLRELYKYKDIETINTEEVRMKLWDLAKDNGVDNILSEY